VNQLTFWYNIRSELPPRPEDPAAPGKRLLKTLDALSRIDPNAFRDGQVTKYSAAAALPLQTADAGRDKNEIRVLPWSALVLLSTPCSVAPAIQHMQVTANDGRSVSALRPAEKFSLQYLSPGVAEGEEPETNILSHKSARLRSCFAPRTLNVVLRAAILKPSDRRHHQLRLPPDKVIVCSGSPNHTFGRLVFPAIRKVPSFHSVSKASIPRWNADHVLTPAYFRITGGGHSQRRSFGTSGCHG